MSASYEKLLVEITREKDRSWIRIVSGKDEGLKLQLTCGQVTVRQRDHADSRAALKLAIDPHQNYHLVDDGAKLPVNWRQPHSDSYYDRDGYLLPRFWKMRHRSQEWLDGWPHKNGSNGHA